jgi:hypothetical protein
MSAMAAGMTQSGYIKKLLERWDLTSCNPALSPAAENLPIVDENEPDAATIKVGQELLGSRLWLSSRTRVDL